MARLLSIYNSDLPSAAPRIVRIDSRRFSIKSFDIDNGYPQRMDTLVKASPTGKQAVNMLAKYIVGQGFDKDQDIFDLVVNSDNETGDQLLRKIAKDLAGPNGIALHVNYNALFQQTEVYYTPFENCRIGIGDKQGMFAVFDNWWNNARFGRGINYNEIDYIDAFNPDPAVIKKQVSKSGGWNQYKGQIFWWSANDKAYPEHRLDTAIDAMEAETLSNITTKGNIINNFGDKVIYLDKGKKADPEEFEEFKSNMRGFIGPTGQRLIVAEVESEEAKPEIITIPNGLNDAIFKYSDEKSRATIYRMMGQPAILHSDLTQGRYNQNQLPEARKAYNNDTEMDRIIMQECFTKVFSNFITPITGDFSIKPLEDMDSATDNTEGANSSTDGNTEDNIPQ